MTKERQTANLVSSTGISTVETQLNISNGPLIIGSATSTGTSSQPLQVTGNAYVSGRVGIGTTSVATSGVIAGILHLQQQTDNQGIIFSHAGRQGSFWKAELSGITNKRFAFIQNDGSSDSVSVVIGRNSHEFRTGDLSTNLHIGVTSTGAGINTLTPAYQWSLVQGDELGWQSSVGNAKASIGSTGGDDGLVFFTGGVTNNPRARISSSGFLQAHGLEWRPSNSTTYRHELYNNQNRECLLADNSNGSLTGTVGIFYAHRSASTAYALLACGSGHNPGVTVEPEFFVRGDGNLFADGTLNTPAADYAEFFESLSGIGLTVGISVVLDEGKVREATLEDHSDNIIGVVRPKGSGKSSTVVGNSAWNRWNKKYLTDDFDQYIMEDHDVVEWVDNDGTLKTYESHRIPENLTIPAEATIKTHDENGVKYQHYKLNPEWDSTLEYVSRNERDEWIIVGLLGQVKLLKGCPVGSRWIKMRDVSETIEEWFIR